MRVPCVCTHAAVVGAAIGVCLPAAVMCPASEAAPLAVYSSPGERVTDARLGPGRSLNTPCSMPKYADKQEWLARRQWLRDHVLLSCGIWPAPRPEPVDAVIFGRVERDGYSVEKVYFESRPGLYVTGNLYRPLGGKPPYPAVANPHGHWGVGRLADTEDGSIPGRCIGQARRGMIAFSYDMMGYNDANQFDHRWKDDRLDLWGISAGGIQTLNSIRVLDFLASLPDADPARLAVTGESGGGTQTFLLVAVDDRPAAAAPVNMVSAHFQGGCVCENPPSLRIGTLNPEIVSIFAPRPLLLVSCTGDWTVDTPTVEGPMVRSVYSLFGEPDRVEWVQENAGHNYNKASREHVYEFLSRVLLGERDKGAATEQPFTVEPQQSLLVWADRQPPKRMNLAELSESLIAEKQARLAALYPAEPGGREAFERAYRPAYEHALLASLPDQVIAKSLGESISAGISVQRLVLGRPGVGDAVPGLLFAPADGKAAGPATLLVAGDGKDALLEGDGTRPGELIRTLVGFGRPVLAIDPFLTGEAAAPEGAPDRAAGIEFFTTYNRTDVAERVQDILTAAAYLRALSPGHRVDVVGVGEGGLWCALARPFLPDGRSAVDLAGFDADSDSSYLHRCPVPLIRQAGGLATAFELAAPRPLMAWNCVTATGGRARRAYRAAGADGALTLRTDRPGDAELAAWLMG